MNQRKRQQRDLQVVLLDIGPDMLEGLRTGHLGHAEELMHGRGDGLGFHDAAGPAGAGIGGGGLGDRAEDDGARAADETRGGGGGGVEGDGAAGDGGGEDGEGGHRSRVLRWRVW